MQTMALNQYENFKLPWTEETQGILEAKHYSSAQD